MEPPGTQKTHLLDFKNLLRDIMRLWTGFRRDYINWADSENHNLGTRAYISRTTRKMIGNSHHHLSTVSPGTSAFT